jgi:hypothetical protein
MAESAESNRPTVVKPRSTWAITSKTEPTTPIDPLTKSTHPGGQPLVKNMVKPHWNPNVDERPLELLPRSPKFT